MLQHRSAGQFDRSRLGYRHEHNRYRRNRYNGDQGGLRLAVMNELEEWRPVIDYEGLYEVSSLGRVRSVERNVPTRNKWNNSVGTLHVKGRMMKLVPKDTGRLQTMLSKEGHKRQWQVHQLVARAFLGPKPSPKHEVCHNDGDHLNNRPGNLRWGTKSENMTDRVLHGQDHNSRKTHCPRDHEYTSENTYISPVGWRQCRKCKSIRRKITEGAGS